MKKSIFAICVVAVGCTALTAQNQRYTNVGSAYGTGKRAGGFGTRQSNYRRLLGSSRD